ncbi:LysR family transcriptional regulator [Peribacillus alkalitolerans]|uniref:LysR family transcriptional regulator n=1 Tax=Peribacillus alkalitolerans TaxID=1550385 RepID=UPI0013D6694B|nr:LysR family transcriptional regulator [Peribacillus alkalitolerans]
MNILQLEYIIEVAKTKSLFKAAENLHLSPSGISKAISNLESELQIKIFNRSRLGAELTEDGKFIVSKAQEIMLKVEDINIFVNQKLNPEHIKISISANPYAMFIVPSALSIYKKKFPYSQIEIFEKKPLDIISDVVKDKIEFGITTFTDEMVASLPELEFETVHEGGTVLCVSKNSPLAYLENIRVEDLANQSIILFEDPIWSGFVKELFTFVPNMNILLTTNNVNVISEAVSDGLGIVFSLNLFLNKFAVIQNGSVITIPFNHPSQNRFYFGIVYSKSKKLSEHSKQFIKAFKHNIP